MATATRTTDIEGALKVLGIAKNNPGTWIGGRSLGDGPALESRSPVDGSLIGTVSSTDRGAYEQVMNSALQYQIAKPIVDAVMKDAGLSNEGITGMAQSLAGMLGSAPQSAQASAGHAAE